MYETCCGGSGWLSVCCLCGADWGLQGFVLWLPWFCTGIAGSDLFSEVSSLFEVASDVDTLVNSTMYDPCVPEH